MKLDLKLARINDFDLYNIILNKKISSILLCLISASIITCDALFLNSVLLRVSSGLAVNAFLGELVEIICWLLVKTNNCGLVPSAGTGCRKPAPTVLFGYTVSTIFGSTADSKKNEPFVHLTGYLETIFIKYIILYRNEDISLTQKRGFLLVQEGRSQVYVIIYINISN